MTTNTITVNITARAGGVDTTREEGNVPAVFYGPQEDTMSISVNAKDFEKIWKDAGESTIVILKGLGEDKEALIKTVQWHPITDEAIHIDFYIIERGKKLTVSVPLEFVGEAPVEKLGGVVTKVMHELEIEVRPSELPQNIVVDLTKLVDLQSTITVADLDLPESATTTLESNDAIASVSEAVEEDLSAPVGDAMAPDTDGDNTDGDASADTTEDSKEKESKEG